MLRELGVSELRYRAGNWAPPSSSQRGTTSRTFQGLSKSTISARSSPRCRARSTSWGLLSRAWLAV